jgi:hypothetical protein
MTTLKLHINEKALEKVLWLLGHFTKEEVEVEIEDLEFASQKEYIQAELKRIDEGNETFLSLEEFKEGLEAEISKYEA